MVMDKLLQNKKKKYNGQDFMILTKFMNITAFLTILIRKESAH